MGSLRLLCGLGLMGGSIFAQCYDLTSVHLYEVTGRFQERWDRPIWDAKPGEGNFHLDESPWLGGTAEFVLFALGQVQKTDAGWVPLRRSKAHEAACAMTPERSDIHCTWPPYETPRPDSRKMPPHEHDEERWTLTRDGFLHFTMVSTGPMPAIHADPLTETLIRLVNQGSGEGGTFEAILNLNTGAYSVSAHGHARGLYRRRFPDGIELWRDTTLSAKAKLVPQACPASVQKAALELNGVVLEEEARPVPICVVRAKPASSQSSFEFILNSKGASSPEGCVVVDEAAMPRMSPGIVVAPERRR